MSLGIGIGLPFGGGPAASAVIAAPFASVNGAGAYDSWSGEYASTPSIPSPVPFTVRSDGYDATGSTTTHDDLIYVTTRVRQPYPNEASPSALTVAFSDYIYAGATLFGGVVNNATLTSPTPVCNWIMEHRLCVGNSLTLELVAFHRNARDGKQVACVEFTATDGVNPPVTAKVSATTLSGRTGDQNPVYSYKATLDITSLNAGLITGNAKVYPWIGGAAAVADSSLNSGSREFSPRWFLKDTSLAASPPYAYVAKTADAGNGVGVPSAGGVVSATLATAKATPFDTFLNAINAIHTAYSATTGVDGCIIMFGDDAGTAHVLASTTVTRTQKIAAITLTADTYYARANARVSFGAAALRPRLGGSLTSPVITGCLRFSAINVVRTGANVMQGEAGAALEIIWNDVAFDNASSTASWLATTAADYAYGFTVTNLGGNSNLGQSTTPHYCYRGLSVDAATYNVEGWLVVGSAINRPGTMLCTPRSQSGMILYANTFRRPQGTTGITIAGSADVTGAVVASNLIEWTTTTSGHFLAVSNDSATGSNTHAIIINNTFAGFFIQGRNNIFYDDGPTQRNSRLMCVKGNFFTSINTKSDVFRGVNEGNPEGFTPGSPSTRIGNWAFMYGVGCDGNFSNYIDADSGGVGSGFAQAYGGIGSLIGTSNSSPQLANVNFTAWAATVSGPTGGAGGGTYTFTSGSVAPAGIVTTAVLSHDLAGTARPTTADTAGAYVAP
jgi:hypothetical protein